MDKAVNPHVFVKPVLGPNAEGLSRLLNGFLTSIGEPALDDGSIARLRKAMGEEKIFFYVARKGETAIGICSLAVAFSTYRTSSFGVLDDFFIIPEMRKKGVARLILDHVLSDARRRGCRSVIIGCGKEEAPMYKHFGFKTIGSMMAIDIDD